MRLVPAMDPKTVSSLDPKLKEVYDRVMGTANPASSPPAQTSATPTISSQPTTPLPATPVSANMPLGNLSASPFPKEEKVTAVPAPTLSQAPLSTNLGMAAKPLSTPLSSPVMPPLPAQPPVSNPLSTASPEPAHTSTTSPMGRPIVDYAALAAKYATPTPSVSAMTSSHQPVVTPSSTTYGVVNADPAKPVEKEKTEGGSSKKKVLFIVGIPLILIAYAAVWIFIFHVDLVGLLPLPK